MVLPLLVGIGGTVVTIVNHAFALIAVISFARHQRRVGHIGAGSWIDFLTVSVIVFIALIAHIIDIALWAALFRLCGEFLNYATAFYYSAINYTTLGSDVSLTARWKLLGPLEATDAMLMFGVSAAMIFAAIQRSVRIEYPDL